eukprot:3934133-Rhodomonas_salina.1
MVEDDRKPKGGSSPSAGCDSSCDHALGSDDISVCSERMRKCIDRRAPRHPDVSPHTSFSRSRGWRSASLCIAVIFLTCAKVNAFEAASGKLDGANGKEEATPGDHVLSVHDMSIMLEEHNETGLLVEFFLPWCGHSRRLRPEFRRAAAAMAGKPFFARVDCSSGTGAPLCNQVSPDVFNTPAMRAQLREHVGLPARGAIPPDDLALHAGDGVRVSAARHEQSACGVLQEDARAACARARWAGGYGCSAAAAASARRHISQRGRSGIFLLSALQRFC